MLTDNEPASDDFDLDVSQLSAATVSADSRLQTRIRLAIEGLPRS